VSPIRTAAEREEQAELAMLREQADRTADEVARTVAELSRRAGIVRRPGPTARRMAAEAAATAVRAIRQAPRQVAGQPGVRRAALAAVPVLALAAFTYAAAHGKITISYPERARAFARPAPSCARRRKG
jgi:hypothetical protein